MRCKLIMKKVMSIQNRIHSSGVPTCHVVLMIEDDDDDLYTFLTN